MAKLYAPRTGVEADIADEDTVERLLNEGWTKTKRKPKSTPAAGADTSSGDSGIPES